jgi:protein involved in ribonucleotide reduction
MIVVFDSMTGNVKRFAHKLGERLSIPVYSITEEIPPQGEFLFVTYTFMRGEVPRTSRDFLMRNGSRMVGVASSGSINWGTNFGKAGDVISSEYGVPLVVKFNKSGYEEDIKQAERWVNGMD